MRKLIIIVVAGLALVGCEGDTIKFCRCNHAAPNATMELYSSGAEYYIGSTAPAVDAPLYVEVQD